METQRKKQIYVETENCIYCDFSKFRDCLFSLRAVGPISLDTAQILNDLCDYIGFDDQDLISDGVRAVSSIFTGFCTMGSEL